MLINNKLLFPAMGVFVKTLHIVYTKVTFYILKILFLFQSKYCTLAFNF